MKMRNYKSKICVICGKEYIPTINTQKYCSKCRSIGNKIQEKQHSKQYYLKNCEKIKQKVRQYHSKYREQIKEKDRQHYLEHSKQRKQIVKQWRGKNPEKLKQQRIKCKSKRRNFGFIPLNKYFEGSVFHHIDMNYGIYIPEKIHQSIYHSVLKNYGMDAINTLAWNYI